MNGPILERRIDGALFPGVGRTIGTGMMHHLVEAAADQFISPIAEHFSRQRIYKSGFSVQIHAVDPLAR